MPKHQKNHRHLMFGMCHRGHRVVIDKPVCVSERTGLSAAVCFKPVWFRQALPVQANCEGAAYAGGVSAQRRGRTHSHQGSARPARKWSIRGMLEMRKPESNLSAVLCPGRRRDEPVAHEASPKQSLGQHSQAICASEQQNPLSGRFQGTEGTPAAQPRQMPPGAKGGGSFRPPRAFHSHRRPSGRSNG